MPHPRTPDARSRTYQADRRKRTEREARRRIVPLTQRPADDGIVDHTAIDLALRHWTRHGARLTRAELVEAVRIGRERGVGIPTLADALCLREREVERLKTQWRANVGSVA